MAIWLKIKRLMKKGRLGRFFVREFVHETKFVVGLSLTFIGATLVGRSAWGWIVDYSDRFVAFVVGVLILFVVAIIRHHTKVK